MNFQETKEKLLVKYSDSPVIRGALIGTGSVASPTAGAILAAIDILLTHQAGKIQERRVSHLITSLCTNLEQYDNSKIDTNFFQSEEWYDIFINAVSKSSQTRHNEKIDIFSKILSGSIISPNKIDEAESYLKAINELSINEIFIANLIYKHQGAHSMNPGETEVQFTTRTGWKSIQEYCNKNGLDYVFILQRIANAGLIKEVTGTYYDYKGGHYVLTDTFKSLMKFINDKG